MDYQHYTSIFQKIGGIEALHDIVDKFYDKVMADTSLKGFFEGANMDIQRGKMKAFLMMALGGPVKFTGKDMRKAHLRLVADGLSDVHFHAVGAHLVATLQEFGVDDNILKEIGVVLESVRADVLNK
jgi:hemoglobin